MGYYLPCICRGHGVADSRDLQAANVGKKMLIDNLLLFIPWLCFILIVWLSSKYRQLLPPAGSRREKRVARKSHVCCTLEFVFLTNWGFLGSIDGTKQRTILWQVIQELQCFLRASTKKRRFNLPVRALQRAYLYAFFPHRSSFSSPYVSRSLASLALSTPSSSLPSCISRSCAAS